LRPFLHLGKLRFGATVDESALDSLEELPEHGLDDGGLAPDPASQGSRVSRQGSLAVVVEVEQATVGEILLVAQVRRRAGVVADVPGIEPHGCCSRLARNVSRIRCPSSIERRFVQSTHARLEV